MNEHAGPACTLSVLIVGIFAVLLHEKDQSPTLAKPRAPEPGVVKEHHREPQSPRGESISRSLETSPGSSPPSTSIQLHEAGSKGDPSRTFLNTASASTTSASSANPTNRPVKLPSKPKPRLIRPRSPFTVVGPGESLADVATRVYGSPDAKEAIWKANRDQIAQVDSPLVRGTLLRTP